MPVSKRTRFEVLKRDKYTCRYCGGSAPDVVLTVDHVTPVTLGGSDKPDNLVAACRDCNAGKSSTSPDASLVEDVKAEDIRWARAIKAAAASMAELDSERKARGDQFREAWRRYDHDLLYLPDGWRASVGNWLDAGLPMSSLLESLDIAMGNRGITFPNAFAYMGGVARKKIERLHEAAKELIETGAAIDDPVPPEPASEQPIDCVPDILGRWEALAGREVAEHVTPESYADGRLIVRTDSTAWATQMKLLASTVARRLNEEFGDGTVTRIEVVGRNIPRWVSGHSRKGAENVNGS